VRRLLKRCIERDLENRLHDIADARLELDEALDPAPETPAPEAKPRPRFGVFTAISAALLLALVAVVLTTAAVAWVGWQWDVRVEPQQPGFVAPIARGPGGPVASDLPSRVFGGGAQQSRPERRRFVPGVHESPRTRGRGRSKPRRR
jgi:hypothetical protein